MSGEQPAEDRFFEDVGDGSPRSSVLFGHLWLEAELLNSLRAAMPFPNQVSLTRLPFDLKVGLVAAHGLMAEDEKGAFKRLNVLRNRIVHDLHYDLAEKDEVDLLNSLGKRHRVRFAMVVRSDAEPMTFPDKLQMAINVMHTSLQLDREAAEAAHVRLRAAATRVEDAVRNARPVDEAPGP